MANNEDHQLDITPGLEFTSLHSSSDDGLDALTASGEESRGPRPDQTEPGRTYECELWCRDASRQVAGCLGFTTLVLTYAALGAVLFMAIGKIRIIHTFFWSLSFVSRKISFPSSSWTFTDLMM